MKKLKKQRLDAALVACGLAPDLEKARRLIMAGEVVVNEGREDKPGTMIKADARLRLKDHKKGPFVSRAGGKLDAALSHWPIDPTDKICLDLGASTGGFTDCLLQKGAARVYAVDVGTNQLVWHLRNHPQVVCLEKTHARDLNVSLIPEPIALLVVDVSFTSLRYVLPSVFPLLVDGAEGVLLYKPQFEVGRHQVQPGGLVGEEDALAEMMIVTDWLTTQGLEIRDSKKSPVKGRDGNQEYLLWVAFRP